MAPITETPEWKMLLAHRDEIEPLTLSDHFNADAGRFETLSFEVDGLVLDLSKNRLNAKTVELLVALADAAGLETRRDSLFAGDNINETEARQALHPALRDRSELTGGGVSANAAQEAARQKAFVDAVRDGQESGATSQKFTDVLSIGIGGSHLGPMMVARALRHGDQADPAVHFVANMDGIDISETLGKLDPATTMVVVISKTFTTPETVKNAETARDWITKNLGADGVASHFVGVSADIGAVERFGIPAARTFPIWDWVGGRYSLWSAVGLSAALALGWTAFDEMNNGAHAMDQHFTQQPSSRNLPVLLGLADLWNVSFLGYDARAVLPYDHRLTDLPAYLQQLEMESNGKGVDLDGRPVPASSPVVFGGPGTITQHSFHQMLHQGPQPVPAEFIGIARTGHDLPDRQDALIANMLAQAEALAFGADGNGDPHRACPGNRPSTTILMDGLTPDRLGKLVSLYEHKVFVQGVVWGINSFDQFGVELGKRLAARLTGDMTAAEISQNYDASTVGLLRRYRAWRDKE
mgnify:FL=1